MGDYNGIGEALSLLFIGFFLMLFIAVPLAIWKVIDIVLWAFSHLEIGLR